MATFDMPAYGRLWRDRQGRFVSVTREARLQLAMLTEALAKRVMQQLIYSKPEDVGPSGRKLWVRTGELMAGEHAVLKGDTEVILTNAVSYAEPRHEAGKPGRRAINPARFAPWRDVLAPVLRQLQLSIYENAIQEWAGSSIGPGSGQTTGATISTGSGSSSGWQTAGGVQRGGKYGFSGFNPLHTAELNSIKAAAAAAMARDRLNAAVRAAEQAKAELRAYGPPQPAALSAPARTARGAGTGRGARGSRPAPPPAGGGGSGGGAIPFPRPRPKRPKRLFGQRRPRGGRR